LESSSLKAPRSTGFTFEFWDWEMALPGKATEEALAAGRDETAGGGGIELLDGIELPAGIATGRDEKDPGAARLEATGTLEREDIGGARI